MQEALRHAVQEALEARGADADVDFTIEHPGDIAHGDYATNAALVAAKRTNMNPRTLAEELAEELGSVAGVDSIEVAGPGFINFHLTRNFYAERIAAAREQGAQWGRNEILAGKRIMVEYTQPNPFKVFHIGHLMSNAIGESLSRLIEASGAEVFRANYQGDVGRHIGQTLWGLRQLGYDPEDVARVGEAYAYGSAQYESDPEAKREIIALTKKVYAEDPDIMDMYTKGRAASLAHFDVLYERLGSKFDALFFESETWKKGKEVVEAHIGDIFAESEGAVIYRGEQDGLHTRVFINAEGVPTYEAKDVGLAYAKKERWPFDLCLSVTAVEQEAYFQVVFRAIEQIDPYFAGRLAHVPHGMMRFAAGKMSSRTGNVISGEEMLDQARDAALQKIAANENADIPPAEQPALADAIGVAAVKYMILKQSLEKNIVYDLDRALSFEGDSGPYLQYTHARTCSVLEKAQRVGVSPSVEVMPDAPYAVERLLYRFPEVIEMSVSDREPHHVATFLTELASAFNTFYATERIADADDASAPYKAALTDAVRQTLANGLWCLGITAPERM